MFNDIDRLLDAVENGFGRKRVLVAGDLMLDRYLWGSVSRISPEAPVPVVRSVRQSEALGGAANVAANLAGLGLEVMVAGFLGDDIEGQRVLELMRLAGVGVNCVSKLPNEVTITKTRIIGGHQQMLRVDVGEQSEFDSSADELLSKVSRHLSRGVDVVVLSDYAKGVLSEKFCRGIVSVARGSEIPVLVDPKGRDYDKYCGATAILPNTAEIALVTGKSTEDMDELLASAEILRQRLGARFIVVTRGEGGMTLIERRGIRTFPAIARDVYDVTGAGDTVIATLAAGVAVGLDLGDVLKLANTAASVVVGKVGTAPLRPGELRKELETQQRLAEADKICNLEALVSRVEGWRERGDKIVFTNGCFDLLHAGHVTCLELARRLGDRQVVAVNSDRSVRALKGDPRPIIRQEDRARILAALGSVDAVVIFDEETPIKVINAIRPDVLAKGQDYTEREIVGARDVRAWGGRVVLIPLLDGRSSNDIVARLGNTATVIVPEEG